MENPTNRKQKEFLRKLIILNWLNKMREDDPCFDSDLVQEVLGSVFDLNDDSQSLYDECNFAVEENETKPECVTLTGGSFHSLAPKPESDCLTDTTVAQDAPIEEAASMEEEDTPVSFEPETYRDTFNFYKEYIDPSKHPSRIMWGIACFLKNTPRKINFQSWPFNEKGSLYHKAAIDKIAFTIPHTFINEDVRFTHMNSLCVVGKRGRYTYVIINGEHLNQYENLCKQIMDAVTLLARAGFFKVPMEMTTHRGYVRTPFYDNPPLTTEEFLSVIVSQMKLCEVEISFDFPAAENAALQLSSSFLRQGTSIYYSAGKSGLKSVIKLYNKTRKLQKDDIIRTYQEKTMFRLEFLLKKDNLRLVSPSNRLDDPLLMAAFNTTPQGFILTRSRFLKKMVFNLPMNLLRFEYGKSEVINPFPIPLTEIMGSFAIKNNPILQSLLTYPDDPEERKTLKRKNNLKEFHRQMEESADNQEAFL